MSEELKPCPWCNEPAILDYREAECSHVRDSYGVYVNHLPDCPNIYIEIDYKSDKDKVIKEWNNRPLEDALRVERDGLKQVEEYADELFADCNRLMDERDSLQRKVEFLEEQLRGCRGEFDDIRKENDELRKHQIPEGWICHP